MVTRERERERAREERDSMWGRVGRSPYNSIILHVNTLTVLNCCVFVFVIFVKVRVFWGARVPLSFSFSTIFFSLISFFFSTRFSSRLLLPWYLDMSATSTHLHTNTRGGGQTHTHINYIYAMITNTTRASILRRYICVNYIHCFYIIL